MPSNAEGLDGLVDGDVGGVVLECDEIGVVDKRLALTMSGNLLTWTVSVEPWTESVKGQEDDQVNHQPDRGAAGAALHDSVKEAGEDMEGVG